MVRVGMEAAQLRQWSSRQRLTALKRIIPRGKVTAALRHLGRERRFCPRVPDGFMIWFVVALGLFCKDCYRQIYRWLMPWKKGDVPGRSTLCEARQRLGVLPLLRLAREVVKLLAEPQTSGAFYGGMRKMTVDGFVVNLEDTPANQRAFDRPGNGRGAGAFPQARIMGLMEAGTHVFWRWLIRACRRGETGMVPALLRQLQSDMLLLWDRGMTSFELVQQVVKRQANLLAHWKSNRILPPVRRLSDGSYLAAIYRNDADRRAARNGLDVRVIEYTLNDPLRGKPDQKHRLLTTLLDEQKHPALTLVELYHVRWEEELGIDEFKTHEIERPVLRSQTPAGVVQEIYGLLLGHYVIRTLMYEAAKKAGTTPLQMSFTGTLKILRCRLPECPPDSAGRRRWWQRLLAEIAEESIPPRRNRVNPRVIKRQQCPWPVKRPRHRHPPQPTRPFRDCVALLR